MAKKEKETGVTSTSLIDQIIRVSNSDMDEADKKQSVMLLAVQFGIYHTLNVMSLQLDNLQTAIQSDKFKHTKNNVNEG